MESTDREAEFVELVRDCRERLLAMVRRRIDPALRNRVDAEDVLSEAFINARRRWPSFDEGDGVSPYGWLYRIVRDSLFEAWRKHTRHTRDHRRDMPFPEQSSLQLGLRLVAPGTSPSGQAIRAEDSELIRGLLEQLPQDDKDILWMKYYDQLSFSDAGAVLDISANAATQRCARALRKLKKLWSSQLQ